MPEEYKYLNLDSLNDLCKGDHSKYLKYLKQFSTLIPVSIINIEKSLEEENTEKIFQEIHFIHPQLLFFGIDDFSKIMNKKPQLIQVPGTELRMHLNTSLLKIKKALVEVDQLIEQFLNSKPK